MTQALPGWNKCGSSGPASRSSAPRQRREGLDRVAAGQVDLIILDQRLNSGTSGLEFFRQLKEAGYNVPAILVTGLNDENTLIEALRAGVRDSCPRRRIFSTISSRS